MRVGALFRGMLRMKMVVGRGAGWVQSIKPHSILNFTLVLNFYFRRPVSKDITEMKNKNSN